MPSPKTFPSFSELAEEVTKQSSIIKTQLDANSLPYPSFEASASHVLPPLPEIQQARLSLIDAAIKLTQLAIGPDEFYTWNCFFVGSS